MTDFNMTPHYGKDVIPFLAELYKQLYIRPAEDALETYKAFEPAHAFEMWPGGERRNLEAIHGNEI